MDTFGQMPSLYLINIDILKIPSHSGAQSNGLERYVSARVRDEFESSWLNRMVGGNNTDISVERGLRESNHSRYTIVVAVLNLEDLLNYHDIAVSTNANSSSMARMKKHYP